MKAQISKFLFPKAMATIISLCLFAFGQETQKPILVDEIGITPCEAFASRLDTWFQELENDPNGVGYAVISGPDADLLAKIQYREWIRGQLQWRARTVNTSRFTIVEGPTSNQLNVRLWRAKRGTLMPFQIGSKWNHSLGISKPVEYYASVGDGGICPPINHGKVFVDLVNANPRVRGHVVFYEGTSEQFRKRKADFVKENNAAGRFRFVFKRSNKGYDGHYALWFVPIKKK